MYKAEETNVQPLQQLSLIQEPILFKGVGSTFSADSQQASIPLLRSSWHHWALRTFDLSFISQPWKYVKWPELQVAIWSQDSPPLFFGLKLHSFVILQCLRETCILYWSIENCMHRQAVYIQSSPAVVFNDLIKFIFAINSFSGREVRQDFGVV